MLNPALQASDLDTFKMGNSLLKNPSKSSFGKTFEEILDDKVNEVKKEVKDKASTLVEEKSTKKKKTKEHPEEPLELPNISQIAAIRNSQQSKGSALFEKSKEFNKSQEEDFFKDSKQQLNVQNAIGQPLIQPVHDQGQRRRMTKSQLLEHWEKLAPSITEDITKKAVRLDIPLLNDVQAVVLRMNRDRSISASLLGSHEMGELVKQNKDKLDKNLRHHNLSLREFNAYRSELEFTSESGTRKKKKQAKPNKKVTLDIM